MMTTSSMELLSFVVLKDKADSVAQKLLSLGIFHPVDIRDIEDKISGLNAYQASKESEEIERLLQRTAAMSRRMRLPQLCFQHGFKQMTYAQAAAFLDEMEKDFDPLAEKSDDLRHSLETNQSILAQVKEHLAFPVTRNTLYTFLEVSTGKIEEKNIALLERSLKDVPHVIYPFQKQNSTVFALVIGLRRDRALLDKVLKDVAWQEVESPKEAGKISADAQQQLIDKIEQNKEDLKKAQEAITDFGQRNREAFCELYSFLLLKRSLLEARRLSYLTDATAVFSGWVPKEERGRLEKEIKALTDVSYVEAKSAEETHVPKEEVPVLIRHGAALKPFDLLINTYGIPRYGTVDPTAFVAIMFLVMFGVMFGDLGHGVVLGILGFLLRRRKHPQVKQAGTLMIYSGISAAIFGFLYGSEFGVEFQGLWLKPTENVMYLFRLSLLFGIGVISLGIILNIINALRDRDYLRVLFDKAGLIAGLVYWAGIGVITKTVVERSPASGILVNTVFIGFALLFLGPIIKFMVSRHGTNFFEAFMHGLVEVLEVGMGYLANTVSFLRITGFALTHASLFLAIFELSKAMKGLPGGLILVFGNIIVFCLEGLVVTMQSVRLNYYEFFSKFFLPGKHLYKPLTIAGNESIKR